MSDFDREAERERLREKYEKDEEKRKNTQRMSELLLQGATMTNKHCEVCGDPIFRYDGEEFCATCRAEGRAQGAAAAGDTDPATVAARDETAPATNDGEATTAAAESNIEERTVERASPQSPAPDERSSAEGRPTDDESTAPPTSHADSEHRQYPSDQSTAPSRERTERVSTAGGERGGLGEARASLVRTLSRLASAAESTEDPRQAREYLEAAREAAETLAALDRR